MLLKPYELVLADEPTGNLGYRNKNEIIEIFKEIKKMEKLSFVLPMIRMWLTLLTELSI